MGSTASASGRLRAFQDGFARALLGPDATAGGLASDQQDMARLVAQPGFAVYRNTVMTGCIDALQANYPAVSRLVGDEWFRAAAAVHVRENLPRHPSLLDYGSDFADFLAGFAPAGELPYLVGVARLDRLWTEAHIARDETPIAAAAVARLSSAELARTVLRPHASARWAWFDGQPVVTIWERNRKAEALMNDEGSSAPDIDWRAEGVLITRPCGAVEWAPLGIAGCAFLDACAAGGTLADAAAAALAADPCADLAALMTRTLDAGAFGRLDVRVDRQQEHLR